MSRLRRTLGLLGRVPTVFRTLAHLEGAQARAQIQHMIRRLPKPCRAVGPAPTLAIRETHTAFLPPPAHVKSRADGQIEILSVLFDAEGGIDWESNRHGPLFAYHLHQHEYLRLPHWTPDARSAQILDWIRSHREGIGWDPHPISLRVLCWGRLLTTPGALGADDSIRDAMLHSMADQLETLSRGLEVRLQANHLLSNLLALVFGGLLIEGSASSAWRGHADALLRELDRQVRPDGGHEERSPMYHALLLENVFDLLNLALPTPERAPAGLIEGLRSTASRMLGALEFFTDPDGRIALFADSAFDIAADTRLLREYAARLAVPLADPQGSALLPQTGYFRLRAGDFDLIASVSAPSPSHQPGHAHCDALAFELSVGGDRLITDTGLFEYRPGARRDRARRTSSHSTFQFDGQEQAEIWAAHRVGGRPEVILAAWDASGAAEATCRGWARGAPLHRRFYSVERDGVSILDRVEGGFREVQSTLPIDPDWQVTLDAGRAVATRGSGDGTARKVEIGLANNFEWTLVRDAYYPTFGSEIERPVLVGRARECEGATTRFRWID
jgi:uncharacterized heparinase superfamily protein